MNEISARELYELYLDTLARCTPELRNRSAEEIEYELFEEFDIGAHSFLHEDNLLKLYNLGYIDRDVMEMSKRVRERWIALQDRTWNVEDIRTDKAWDELFELCERILKSTSKNI